MSPRRALPRLAPWLLAAALGCGGAYTLGHANDPATVVRRHMETPDRLAATRYLADDFQMWYERREGPGIPKSEMLPNGGWDETLHSRTRIVSLVARGDTVVVQAHEDNDFSRLLGYAGWDPTLTFEVSPEGRIRSELYEPRAGAPSWRTSLDAALPWLKANRPDAVARLLPDNKLVRSHATALEWVAVLREWRAATGRPDPLKSR